MNTIKSVVIHKLVKDRHGAASILPRATLLPLSEPVEKLVNDIISMYSDRTGKGYGRFEADVINYPASGILREAFESKKKTFIVASLDLMSVLAVKAGSASLATGGFVLMAHVINSAKSEWFIVAIINNIHSSAIDENTLEVFDTIHVDVDNLRVAGRVNITEWLKGGDGVRYIGFLKQRGEVSDYFKLFLGCNELIKSTEETKKLVVVLKEFAKKSALNPVQEEVFLQTAYDYCKERYENDQPLILEFMSNAIWPDDPKTLRKVMTESDLDICDGFVPDRRCLGMLVKIKGKAEYWSVEIDRKAIVNGDVRYDRIERTLTFRNLPEKLENELISETPDAPI